MCVAVVGGGTVDEKQVERSLFSAVMLYLLSSGWWFAGVGTLLIESWP